MRALKVLTSAVLVFSSLLRPQPAECQQVAEVQIAPVTVTLAVGERRELLASAYDSRGDNVSTARFVWVSNPPGIVRVEEDPSLPGIVVLVGVQPGIASVEARVGNQRAQAAVQVVGAGGNPGAGAGTGVATVLQIEPGSIFLLPTEEIRPQPRFLNDDGDLAAPMAVTWRFLGTPNVAEITAQGAILGLGPGTGVLEASTHTGLVSRVMVEISQRSFAFATPELGLSPGLSDTIRVNVPEQNSRPLANSGLIWRSTNVSVARVTPRGVAIGVAPGQAEIVATGYGQESRLPVMVHRQVEELLVTPRPSDGIVAVPLGGARVFEVTAIAADETPVPEAPLTWVLTDTTVGTFDLTTLSLTGNVLGSTRLTVRAPGEGLEAVWDVEVVAGGLELDPDAIAISRGSTRSLTAFFTDDTGEQVAPAANVIWSSSDPAIVEIDTDGNAIAHGFGSVQVIANTPWGSVDTAYVYVTGQVLVTSTRGGAADLYTFDIGTPEEIHRITDQPGSETAAVYSPDGSKIAYVSDMGGNLDIFVVNSDGSNRIQLTTTVSFEDSPAWSLDGTQILYESDASGSPQVWIMNADGSDQRQLTQGDDANQHPVLSPDGQSVAFVSRRDGNADIYLMRLDGTQQSNLTQTEDDELMPAWMGDSSIAFVRVSGRGNDQRRSLLTMTLNVTRDTAPLSPTVEVLNVSDFAISWDGEMVAVTHAAQGASGEENRLYLIPLVEGGIPIEVPREGPGDQLVSPSFRRN